MASSGLGSQFGAKKETTWGTAVTVDKFFEFESESLALDRTYFDGLGLRAARTFAPSNRTKATTRTAGGDLSVVFPQKLGGFFLDLMVAPTITPVVATGTAYNSTFNIGASVPTKSATLQVNKPTTAGVDTAFTYPGSVLVSATFSMEVGGVLTASFTWACKDETTPATTPAGAALATATYVAGNDVWAHQEFALTYAGGAVPVTGVTWTWEQPFALDRFFLERDGDEGAADRERACVGDGNADDGVRRPDVLQRVPVGRVRVAGRYRYRDDGDLGCGVPDVHEHVLGSPDPGLVSDGRRPRPAGPLRAVRRQGRRRRERPVGVRLQVDGLGRLVASRTGRSGRRWRSGVALRGASVRFDAQNDGRRSRRRQPQSVAGTRRTQRP
jgi:hypothetical protein